MRPNNSNRYERRNGPSKTLLIIVFLISLLLGLVGGVLGAAFFAKPGSQGEQGLKGVQGLQGPQGLQGVQGIQGLQGEQGVAGVPGVNGTNGINSILQIIQNGNSTVQTTTGYTALQWLNMSVFDHSMNMTVSIRQNSRVFVEFSATLSIRSPDSLWIRIVIDDSLNSTLSVVSVGPPMSAGTFRLSSHIEFLTNPLASGQHRIDVQFYLESGAPIILDRTLTFMELTG